MQGQRLHFEALAGSGRELLQAQRWVGIHPTVGLKSQLMGQKSQDVGRRGLRDGLSGRVGVGGQRVGLHARQARVVAEQGIQPVAQPGVVAQQIAGRCAGAHHEMLALVHVVVNNQTQIGGRFALQLPIAHGLVHAFGVAQQGAFLQHEIAKIQRHAFFLQHPVDDGKGGIGEVDPRLKRGLVAAQAVYLLLHQTLGAFVQLQMQAERIEGRGHCGCGESHRGNSRQRPHQEPNQQEKKSNSISHKIRQAVWPGGYKEPEFWAIRWNVMLHLASA